MPNGGAISTKKVETLKCTVIMVLYTVIMVLYMVIMMFAG